MPGPVPQMDRPPQPTHPQKRKVPSLEKHLVDQLSKEEHDSLNAKLKDATEGGKKAHSVQYRYSQFKACIIVYA